MILEFSEEKIDHLQKMWHSPLSNAKNEDFETSIGGEASIEVGIGLGILSGIEAEGSTATTVEVSHRLVQEEDKESSTTITLELGDCEFPWVS